MPSSFRVPTAPRLGSDPVGVAGSTVVVTGASEGIGRAVALELARAGASVLAVARSEARLAELAAEADGITALPADLSEDEGRAAVAEAAGEIDALVNVAGVAWLGLVEDMPVDEVRHLFEVNVFAVFDLTARFLPAMQARRSGHVVVIGSILGNVSTPPLTVYCATKAALRGYTEGLRRELLGQGVDVTLVNPGAVTSTEVLDRAGGVADGSFVDEVFDLTGVEPELVAAAVHRALDRPGWPGFRSLSVPRVTGLSQLGALPGASWVVDQGFRLLRSRMPLR